MINTNQSEIWPYGTIQYTPATKVSKLNQISLNNKTHYSDFFYTSNKRISTSVVATPKHTNYSKKFNDNSKGYKKTESVRERKNKIQLELQGFSKNFIDPQENLPENLQIDYSATIKTSKKSASSKPKANEIPKKQQKNSTKIFFHPARFVSQFEIKNSTKQKSKMPYESKVNDFDFSSKIIENDKKYFENELMFRKLRKHKIVKKLHINYDEDPWEWSSYGSSPSRKVTFKE